MDGNNVQTLILNQLRSISEEVKRIPELQARLNALDESTRAVIAELRTRDQAQQQALDDLRSRNAETMAAVAGVSATLAEQKYTLQDLCKRLAAVETQVKATFDGQLQVGRRLREVEAKTATLVEPAALQALLDEIEGNRPWLNGIKWFLRVVFGLAATALGGGLLWLLAQSILGGLGG